MERPISIGAGLICVLIHRSAGRASLGRIFQDSDWLRDGPMRRIGPPWGIFGQESLQIPPAERSPGSTLGLGPLLDIQTFGGRRRRQFEPRYARVEPPPAPTASGPISNIGPRPRADPRTAEEFVQVDDRGLPVHMEDVDEDASPSGVECTDALHVSEASDTSNTQSEPPPGIRGAGGSIAALAERRRSPPKMPVSNTAEL